MEIKPPQQIMRLEYAYQCPRCQRHNLVPSETPGVRYICPDDDCGYYILDPITINPADSVI